MLHQVITPGATRHPANIARRRWLTTTLLGCGLAFGLSLTAPTVSAANTATRTLAVARSIEIAAPVDKVWAIVGNFGDMSYMKDVVSKTEIVQGENNRVGAQRAVTLNNDGGLVLETLTARRERPHTLSYRMDQGPLPVSHYHATIEVIAMGEHSRVTWSGSFRHKAAATTAADNTGAKVAVDLMGSIYEGGLAAIKRAAER